MRRVLLILALAVPALGVTTWLLHPAFRPAAAAAKSNYQFIHCPNCGLETSYSPTIAENPCPRCLPKHVRMIPTEVPAKFAPTTENPYVRFNVAVGVELVAVLAAVVYVLYNPPRKKDADEFDRTNCPFCKQKLRFPRSQRGGSGGCPRCRRKIHYPERPDGARR